MLLLRSQDICQLLTEMINEFIKISYEVRIATIYHTEWARPSFRVQKTNDSLKVCCCLILLNSNLGILSPANCYSCRRNLWICQQFVTLFYVKINSPVITQPYKYTSTITQFIHVIQRKSGSAIQSTSNQTKTIVKNEEW